MSGRWCQDATAGRGWWWGRATSGRWRQEHDARMSTIATTWPSRRDCDDDEERHDMMKKFWTRLLHYKTKYWTPAKPWAPTFQYKTEYWKTLALPMWEALWTLAKSLVRSSIGSLYSRSASTTWARNLLFNFKFCSRPINVWQHKLERKLRSYKASSRDIQKYIEIDR